MSLSLQSQAIQAKKKRKNPPFRENWLKELGLAIGGLDPRTKKPKSLHCRFCMVFGRETTEEQMVGRMRAKTSHIKTWADHQYRTDHFREHMRYDHPSKFAVYQSLPMNEARDLFFTNGNSETSVATLMRQQQPREHQPMSFFFKKSIVDTVVEKFVQGEVEYEDEDEVDEDSNIAGSITPRERIWRKFTPLDVNNDPVENRNEPSVVA